jgi:hypothetical protein
MKSKEKFVISKSEVRSFDRSHLNEFALYEGNFEGQGFILDRDPRYEDPYNLYGYLSHKFNNTTILDIGTRSGNSAISFSSNPNNKVISFDIKEWPSFKNLKKDNIELRLGDFMQDTSINYEEVSIIMIDVDPHDGLQEPPMLEFLRNIGWSGLLLLDDTGPNLFPAIYYMWMTIPEEKFDLTDIAHFSGTGLLNFGDKYDIEIVE